MTLGPGDTVGKYRLDRPLAQGGMGSVWVAKHVDLDVEVAVKFLAGGHAAHAESAARFRREARAAAQLKSPHVVRIHDYGVEDGTPYMAMELLDGEDLGRYLEDHGRLSLVEASEILSQAAKGLEEAHEAGIVHRDIKPSNLFLTRPGGELCVKVLDFGIAKLVHPSALDDKTSSQIILGSPHYMSPEQARGTAVDARTDLWSLGIVLFQALTGSLPHFAEYVVELMAKICAQPPPKPSTFAPLSAEVDAFFAKALAMNAADRYPTARAMAEAFAAIAHDAKHARHTEPPSEVGRRASAAAPPAKALRSEDVASAPRGKSAAIAQTNLTSTDAVPLPSTTAPAADRRRGAWVGAAAVAVGIGAVIVWQAAGTGGAADATPAATADPSPSTDHAVATGAMPAPVPPPLPAPPATRDEPAAVASQAPSVVPTVAPVVKKAGGSVVRPKPEAPPAPPPSPAPPSTPAPAAAPVDPTFGIPIPGKGSK